MARVEIGTTTIESIPLKGIVRYDNGATTKFIIPDIDDPIEAYKFLMQETGAKFGMVMVTNNGGTVKLIPTS